MRRYEGHSRCCTLFTDGNPLEGCRIVRLGFVTGAVNTFAEVTNGFTEFTAQARNTACTKQHDNNHKNDNQFCWAKRHDGSLSHCLLGSCFDYISIKGRSTFQGNYLRLKSDICIANSQHRFLDNKHGLGYNERIQIILNIEAKRLLNHT